MKTRLPDFLNVYYDGGSFPLKVESACVSGDIEVGFGLSDEMLTVSVRADTTRLRWLRLRWNFSENDIPSGQSKVFGDIWERGYGNLHWDSIVPERAMPWYCFATNAGSGCGHTSAFGVRVRPASLCFWYLDGGGVTLWMDIRSGSVGVDLGGRTLEAATVIFRNYYDLTAFEACSRFCGEMCSDPLTTKEPVYGANDWYYAYGNNDGAGILKDAETVAKLTKGLKNRPYMVADMGWDDNCTKGFGAWACGNDKYGDMPALAAKIKSYDVKPGIWVRPLQDLTKPVTEDEMKLRINGNPEIIDPSHPEVIERVKMIFRRMREWGFELIKHDFSTFDIFGRWGFQCDTSFGRSEPWKFFDGTKTSAEIVLNLYSAIFDASEGAVLIGCNTISHLCAGLVHLCRTGDDTSGFEWDRTRKMGVNTLAFRMMQNGKFYAADADCVGIRGEVPWKLNRKWLYALSHSGSPLFVSMKPGICTEEQLDEIRKAYAVNSVQNDVLVPLNWTDDACPSEWLLNGKQISFDWYDGLGTHGFSPVL